MPLSPSNTSEGQVRRARGQHLLRTARVSMRRQAHAAWVGSTEAEERPIYWSRRYTNKGM